MAHIPYIVIQPGCEGRIIIRDTVGWPKYFFDSPADLYYFVRRHIEAEPGFGDNFDDKDKGGKTMSTTLREENGRLYLSKSGGYPDIVFNDLDELYRYIAKTKGIKIGMEESACDSFMAHMEALRELNKKTKEDDHMEHTNLSKTVYIFAKEWDFSWSENEYLVARRSFEYRDDLDTLVVSIQDADYIMIVPDDMIQDTARFVKVTGYDVHYEAGNNELALNMSVTHAE